MWGENAEFGQTNVKQWQKNAAVIWRKPTKWKVESS